MAQSTSGIASQVLAFAHDETITICLQGHDETFTVSRALLCSASDYFKSALEGSFAEAESRTLTIPGCDLDTFYLFLYYLTHELKFTGADHPAILVSTGDCDYPDNVILQAQNQASKLWCFGDAYLMPDLQNEAMRLLTNILSQCTVMPGAVAYAFNHAGEQSKLRARFVAEAVHDWNRRALKEEEMHELGAIDGFYFRFLMTSRDAADAAGSRHLDRWYVET